MPDEDEVVEYQYKFHGYFGAADCFCGTCLLWNPHRKDTVATVIVFQPEDLDKIFAGLA